MSARGSREAREGAKAAKEPCKTAIVDLLEIGLIVHALDVQIARLKYEHLPSNTVQALLIEYEALRKRLSGRKAAWLAWAKGTDA